MRTRDVLKTVGAIAAVAALTGASAVPAGPAPVALPDEAALHEQLWSAPASARSAPSAATATELDLGAAVDAIVAAGAIGATARVEVGDEVWADAAGTRGLDRNPPALPHSPFRAASNTKTMIAALVLQEVAAGTWSLDTRIGDVVPGIFPAHPDVTLRELLSHTAGTPYGTDLLLLSHIDDPTSVEESIAVLGDRYPDAEHLAAANAGAWTEPGGFVYSNVAYVALGVALEAATGEQVGDLLRDRIWKPLGMHSTSYPDAPGMRGNALQEAMWDGATWHDLRHFDPSFFSHAGAVVTTTQDLSTFTEALVTGRVVPAELLDDMLTPVSDAPMAYGLGVYRVPDPCEPGAWLYGHDGGAMGTVSVGYTSADGERQVAFAVTGRDASGAATPLYDLNALLVPMLLASCG
ncbi:serine hydrolase domain-containing protein [Agrococcus citreus]|uniref:Beta-lactamase-related domain-containing protein n=1 Tax=Agrococcus citreus TaxID=84643 RepID=A0ABP4JJZ8_9MICO